jgi:hypothetical protein
MPNLTLTCPNTGKPFDLKVAILPGATLSTSHQSVTCSQCGGQHVFNILANVPQLADSAMAPPEQ